MEPRAGLETATSDYELSCFTASHLFSMCQHRSHPGWFGLGRDWNLPRNLQRDLGGPANGLGIRGKHLWNGNTRSGREPTHPLPKHPKSRDRSSTAKWCPATSLEFRRFFSAISFVKRRT